MTLTLRVRAIDETGSPVAGAIVRRADEAVATTDVDGVAIVDGIDTGFAMVTVSHSMPAEAQLVFSFGEGSCGVLERTVTLRRGALLSGTVVTPDGTPLADAMIEVWRADDRSLFIESDTEGNWNVPAVQAGSYEVRAGADGYARGPAISGTHDGRTEQSGVVVRVALGARLSGRIHDATGNPVAGVRVYTEMQPGDDHGTTTDDDGRFEIVGLGAGRHLVQVGRGRWRSSVVMPGDGGHQELDIELPDTDAATSSAAAGCSARVAAEAVSTATATLKGRVLRDGAPVPQFAIVRKGLAAYRWITDPAVICALDGRFTLIGLREASCSVHVLALGSAWASTDTMELQPGAIHDLGDIALQPGLRIAGTVRNEAGQPIEGARVAIGSRLYDDTLRNAVEGNFETMSGPDGTFLLDGIHLWDPRARISASHPLHGASLEHPLAGTDETLPLVLVATGAIDGVIEPHSLMHGGVIVRGDSPEAGSRSVRVRPSGVFAVENLVPGDYTVALVERPSWPRRQVRATVVAGQRSHVRMPPP